MIVPRRHDLQPVLNLPFQLKPESSVLIAGSGGGFDVVCGLPIALRLHHDGHKVHLANFTFTHMMSVPGAEHVSEQLYRIDESCKKPPGGYFPELYVAKWWHEETGEPTSIWCFSPAGVRPIAAGYKYLQKELALDVVIGIDGGVDGLFIGNEYNTATSVMDSVSTIAAWQLESCEKIFVSTAFGTEGYGYEVRHADVLRRIADLIKSDGFLGVCACLKKSHYGSAFLRALHTVHGSMDRLQHSIIASSIEAAMNGTFGETILTPRTETAPVWVSPLTLLYWFFDLNKVATSKPYYRDVLKSETVMQVSDIIEAWRREVGALPRTDIPI